MLLALTALLTLLAAGHGLWIASLLRAARRPCEALVDDATAVGRDPKHLFLALAACLLQGAVGVTVLVHCGLVDARLHPFGPTGYRNGVQAAALPLLLGLAMLAQSFVLFSSGKSRRSENTWVVGTLLAILACAMLILYAIALVERLVRA